MASQSKEKTLVEYEDRGGGDWGQWKMHLGNKHR